MIQFGDYHDGRILIRRLKGSRGGEYVLVKAERMALHLWLRERGSAPGPAPLGMPARKVQDIYVLIAVDVCGMSGGYIPFAKNLAEDPKYAKVCAQLSPLVRAYAANLGKAQV